MTTMETTTKWMPEYEGKTLVIFWDCHKKHNQTVGKLTEHTFRFATRQAMKKGCNRFVVRAARKEDAI